MCLDIRNFKINGMFTCDSFLTSGTGEVWFVTLHSNNCRFNKIEVNTLAELICKLAHFLVISLVILPKDFFPSFSKPKISCSNYIRFIQSKVYKLNQT